MKNPSANRCARRQKRSAAQGAALTSENAGGRRIIDTILLKGGIRLHVRFGKPTGIVQLGEVKSTIHFRRMRRGSCTVSCLGRFRQGAEPAKASGYLPPAINEVVGRWLKVARTMRTGK